MATEMQEYLAALKSKLNLAEVAASYFSLEKKGTNYWACCPFHHEKTPSFAINEQDQYYHCFGCGESGDIFKFVREIENVGFMDAVKILAERAKMPVPQTGFDERRTVELKRKRDNILKILNDTAHFYLNNLNSGNAKEHVDYILKRKIPANMVRKFGLGASLDFYSLPQYLLKKGYDPKDMVDSGVVNSADGKLTDAQGGRLIFPIINSMDEVVAFGGRALKKVDFGKYRNTKETMVFSKGKTLYNINLLKKLKREQTVREVIIVEGYMDTLSLYGAGFKNVVANMGTSLTPDQARLIKRYADTVYVSYDGDGAGEKANVRGLDIFKREGLNIRVVPLPEGLDPDDVIVQRGADGYKKCLEAAMPLIDYKLKVLRKKFDLSNIEQKRNYEREAIAVIRTAESAAEQEDLLKEVHGATGFTIEALKRDLYSDDVEEKQPEAVPPARKDTATAEKRASRFVISAYLFGAKISEECNIEDVPFCDEVHQIIADYIKSKKLMEERVQPSELFEFFEENSAEYEELCRILDYCDGEKLNGLVAEKYFNDCVKKLRAIHTDKQIEALKNLIATQTDGEKRKALTVQLQNLIASKKK